MRAYGVFAGGGVKGAALAGCLQAACDNDVEFAGYAGTSAGSMVAALAAVGYTGKQIRDLMKTDFHPLKFLDDNGDHLRSARQIVDEILPIVSSDRGFIRKWMNLGWLLTKRSSSLKPLTERIGIYEGNSMRSNLLKLLKAKLPSHALPNPQDVTFADLVAANCPPLKIVASDVTAKRSAIFSATDGRYSSSVVQAVRASASYPFVFSSVKLEAPLATQLTDGGLASNLPVFLFATEQRETQYPILAFDLLSPAGTTAGGIGQFVKSLMDTALEASDALLIDLIPGVEHIRVEIPDAVDTLKFDLTPAEIHTLYTSGYAAAAAHLAKFRPLQNARRVGADLVRTLWTRYGNPKPFQHVLWAVTQMIEERTKAKDIRASIMLPTGRASRSRIVTYTYGYKTGDTDLSLELDEEGGCTGTALKERKPVTADLEDARTTYRHRWNMTEEQQSLVAQRQKSMMSVPIFAFSENSLKSRDDRPILGTLSVDSSTPLADTDWVTPSGRIDGDLSETMVEWAEVVSKLLQ